MRPSILLSPVREIAYYTVHILRRRHQEVHGFHTGLWVAVVRDRLDYYAFFVSKVSRSVTITTLSLTKMLAVDYVHASN